MTPAPENKAQSGRLLRSSMIVSAMTMLSRVLGLARDVVFAWYIGAAGGADAFFVAFKIPNFLRRLFAEGAFAQAFVPVLSEFRQTKQLADVRHLVDCIAGCLGASVITISCLAVLGAPVLTFIFAPGFYLNDPQKYQLTVDLIRITFPYLAFISLAGFVGAILNSYDRFAVPAVTPVLLNLVLITAAIFASDWFATPAIALAWGVLIAGVFQLTFQLPFLAQINLLPRPKMIWNDPAVKKVLKLMVPALFGVSIAQINLLLDTVIASLIADGSVSWLYYSDRLIELPLGVFGIAIATVILPTLSRQHTTASESYSQTLDWALRTVLLIAIPATVALIAMAKPIIATLFFHGKHFTYFDMLMSSYSLVAYALGLTAFMLIKVLVTGYFSRQDTRTPVKIGIRAMVANMALNLVFVVPLYWLWQLGHVGLAFATSTSAFMNAFWLLRGLRKQGVYKPSPGWATYLSRLLFASAVMGGSIFVILALLPDFSSWVWWLRVVATLGLCLSGMVIFFGCMMLMGWRLGHLRPVSA